MRDSDDDLSSFVRTLDQPTLSALLIELAATNDLIRKRLQRLRLSSQPRQLAASFRTALLAWRRSERYIDYRDSHAFAAELERWLGEVERELLPAGPDQALELFEAFIESDANFFERADDSDGCIGDAIGTACTLWLRAASRCEPPPGGWTERVCRLYMADEYGAREQLLRSANLLLAEPQLRALVASFESDLAKKVPANKRAKSLPSSVFRASGAIHLLAEALHDPDVQVRAVLQYSPDPNPLQKEEFARAYLAYGRPSDALKWLDGHWDHHEGTRLRLLADAYARLERRDECAEIQRDLFDATGSVEDFLAWRDSAGPLSRAAAEEHARRRAQDHDDPITAAKLFLELGDAHAAESILLRKTDAIDGRNYPPLVQVAEAMEAEHRTLGATACYRALLLGILGRAYAPAYHHGARYLAKLRKLALELRDLQPLESHAAFEAGVKSAHGRKASFWKQVDQSA